MSRDAGQRFVLIGASNPTVNDSGAFLALIVNVDEGLRGAGTVARCGNASDGKFVSIGA
jgi:hypothetical protein